MKFPLFLLILTLTNCGVLDTISNSLISGIYSTQFSVHESDMKKTMDCLKISQQYETKPFGIFHSANSQTHFSQLYYSENSSGNWASTIKLSDRGSQGTVMRVAVKGNAYGYFVAYELENSNGNTIAIRYYQSQQKIKINNFLYQYQLVRIISSKQARNVGTPSLQKVQLVKQNANPHLNEYTLQIKLHYSPDGSHDFPGQGYVNIRPERDFTDKQGKWIGGCYENYKDWQGLEDKVAEGAMRQAGCLGKIGQRDWFLLGGDKYYLYQCNLNPSFDWKSWRIVLYSQTLKQARPIGFILGGDIDLANPHITLVLKDNKNYEFVMTFFLPSEGINPDKQAKAGQCIVKTKFSYP